MLREVVPMREAIVLLDPVYVDQPHGKWRFHEPVR